MEHRTLLECKGVDHWFGDHPVLHHVNFKVLQGQIVALVGPSGCGKSTLLRAIVGTHPPCRGAIIVHTRGTQTQVTAPGRDRGIVYQRYALFPFLTAQDNVALGPMLDRTTIPQRLFRYPAWRRMRAAHLEEAAALLVRLGLGDAITRYPAELSGGMCQRVAIAQALIMHPRILLLDEPFGALDEATREDLQRLLLTLYAENRTAVREGREPPYTILIVTHELNEAIYVGDRVLGLSQYWDWAAHGHARCPGATIVYDAVAPVYLPGDERDFIRFKAQRDTIRRTVFDPACLQAADAFKVFWTQVAGGEGGGILAE